MKQDDPVLLKGIEIGKIESLTLKNDSLTVQFSIEDSYKINEGSEFTIKAQGITGTKAIVVEPLEFPAMNLTDGSIIKSEVEEQFNFDIKNPEDFFYKLINPCGFSDSLLYKVRKLNENPEKIIGKK